MLGEKGEKMNMNKLSIFLVFLIFISFVNFLSLGRFFIEEPLTRGEFETAYVTVRNNFGTNVDDVNVELYIYDLGLMYSSVPSDVSKRDHVVQRLFIRVPSDVPAGEYLAKISVGNDQFRDTQHIMVDIV